jgi:uncharacterized repeat protein (TIGR01451 family)
MKSSVLLQGLTTVCIAVASSAVSAQNTAVQLFGPADVRLSTNGTGYGANENVFNTKILNLTCPASPTGTISSTTDGTGNVLVDNFITLSVTAGSSTTGPSNICLGGTVENGNQQNCFTSQYAGQASKQIGTDPTTLAGSGGVAPIDIGSSLQQGSIQATIGLVDTGGFLAGSTLYLVTNCTPGGVTGPALVTGNPISPSSPTSQQLTQSYPINPTTDQLVQFTYDLSQSEQNNNLMIPSTGSTPSTSAVPLGPTSFQSAYLANTPFATANCLVHTGELLNNSPACTLYTLTCQQGSNPDQAGALCPTSSAPDEIFQEVFDGPGFSLPDITGTGGQTFHQGVGLLEASEGWTGGSCIFDSNSNIAGELCPQNVLNNFSGPGSYKSGGGGKDPNSTFITVAPVPEDLTTVSVPGQNIPGYWINKSSFNVNFTSTPPSLAQNNFVAAPIQSLSYGISSASAVPSPPAPIPGDTLLSNAACPKPGVKNPPPASVFQPPSQSVTLADGQYLVHYFAQDCAGTQELKFTQDSSQSWSTSFYTYPINVDTVIPAVASGPTLSPAPSTNGGVANSYLLGQKVMATYSCTDDRSGIVTCGTSTYAPGTDVLNTGNITSLVPTSTPGPQTFTVNAVDAAGNQTSASVNYLVVAPSVNTYLLNLAPQRVKHNSKLSYAITATLFGKQATTGVTITDPLPAGVTFVQANALQITCSGNKCSNTASCSFANNTVTCSSPSLSLLTPILVTIEVSVQAPAGTTIRNTATLSATNPSVSPGHSVSTANTVVY